LEEGLKIITCVLHGQNGPNVAQKHQISSLPELEPGVVGEKEQESVIVMKLKLESVKEELKTKRRQRVLSVIIRPQKDFA
jgi:hypothetical protein